MSLLLLNPYILKIRDGYNSPTHSVSSSSHPEREILIDTVTERKRAGERCVLIISLLLTNPPYFLQGKNETGFEEVTRYPDICPFTSHVLDRTPVE